MPGSNFAKKKLSTYHKINKVTVFQEMEKLCLEIETAASKNTLDEWSKKNERNHLKILYRVI